MTILGCLVLGRGVVAVETKNLKILFFLCYLNSLIRPSLVLCSVICIEQFFLSNITLGPVLFYNDCNGLYSKRSLLPKQGFTNLSRHKVDEEKEKTPTPHFPQSTNRSSMEKHFIPFSHHRCLRITFLSPLTGKKLLHPNKGQLHRLFFTLRAPANFPSGQKRSELQILWSLGKEEKYQH